MKILGTGSALPSKIVTNDMLSEFLDTSDEWIVPRTGIRSRHVMSSEKIEDLGAEAARKALEMSGLKPEDIDYCICSNVISDYITPGLGCVIGSMIGLECPCVDVNCACPGLIYSMDIAESHYRAGKVKNVLIICAEQPSRMCDWSDRATCVLFGDGAGAVVLGPGDNIRDIKLHSQLSPDKIIEKQGLLPTPYYTGPESGYPLQMKGRDVFKFAVKTSTSDVEDVLKELGMEKSQVNWYIVHQANLRIIDAIKEYLGEPDSKFPINISDHGNSSSASCAILLDEFNRKGTFKSGDILVFSAFGAGLLSGVAVVEW